MSLFSSQFDSLLHEVEISTGTHNTCTFEVPDTDPLSPDSKPLPCEKLSRNRILPQSFDAGRRFDPQAGVHGPLIDRGGRRVLLERSGELTVIASEAAALYGDPITEFTRFWFLCGPHALFVADHIRSSVPVRTTWNWLLDNRDDPLDLKLFPPDRLVARRGDAGLKLFHLGGAAMQGPQHSFIHDACHPLPSQPGEGRPGSGELVRWTEKSASTVRAVVHAFCVDGRGAIVRWHLRTGENFTALEGPGATCSWKLETAPAADHFSISETVSGQHYTVSSRNDGWQLQLMSHAQSVPAP